METHGPKAMADPLGRVPLSVLFDNGDPRPVALDMYTGRVLYKESFDTSEFQEPIYGAWDFTLATDVSDNCAK